MPHIALKRETAMLLMEAINAEVAKAARRKEMLTQLDVVYRGPDSHEATLTFARAVPQIA